MSEIKELQRIVKEFINKRDWDQFHDPKNIAMSIGIEAAELMEIFQWYTNDQVSQQEFIEEHRSEIEDETADVFIYLLSLSLKCKLNLSEIVKKKMERNEYRFPIERVKGKLGN